MSVVPTIQSVSKLETQRHTTNYQRLRSVLISLIHAKTLSVKRSLDSREPPWKSSLSLSHHRHHHRRETLHIICREILHNMSCTSWNLRPTTLVVTHVEREVCQSSLAPCLPLHFRSLYENPAPSVEQVVSPGMPVS